MSPLIFASCRDCPSYFASAETVHHLLLPAETNVHKKWLPAETVRVILLPAESLGRKLNHTVSAGSYFPSTTVSAGSKRSWTVSAEAKYDGQSLQEAKMADSFIPCVVSLSSPDCIHNLWPCTICHGLLTLKKLRFNLLLNTYIWWLVNFGNIGS